jgi:hypothetical protein
VLGLIQYTANHQHASHSEEAGVQHTMPGREKGFERAGEVIVRPAVEKHPGDEPERRDHHSPIKPQAAGRVVLGLPISVNH